MDRIIRVKLALSPEIETHFSLPVRLSLDWNSRNFIAVFCAHLQPVATENK
jgi:hypothetical protein